MRIGILGTRGIPNAYGGFEQFAQFLAEGLVKKGHEVYVYNSHLHPYKQNQWKGIQIIHCRDFENKIGTAGQFIYDLNCLRDARQRSFDILLQLGYTSNSVWYKLWPKKCVNIINMDGLEWKRTKYNFLTRQFLRRAEYWGAEHGDILIADSIGIQKHIKEQYNKPSIFIPYGAEIFNAPNAEVLQEWNITPGKYFLLIARMEPENNIETIIKGYLASIKPYPLIIVGNTKNKFGSYLKGTYTDPNIKFTEGIYDQFKVNNLRFFSLLYFHGHSVGGTNPSLLEAMACSCKIAAHNNVFNKAILNDDAFYFTNDNDIKDIIDELFYDTSLMEDARKSNMDKVKTLYSWEKIIEAYDKVFSNAFKKDIACIKQHSLS